jgi:ribosome-binding protein aMBF1 (putative translation factor)
MIKKVSKGIDDTKYIVYNLLKSDTKRIDKEVSKTKREQLVIERNKINKTQKEVAQSLGISEIYVRKLESGMSKPGRDTMIAFERYYGISMRDLFPDIFLPENDTERIETILGTG